jgi:hypothetical protein
VKNMRRKLLRKQPLKISFSRQQKSPLLNILKKALSLTVTLALFCIIIFPWGLYWIGLYGINGTPDLPVKIASDKAQQALWTEVGGKGSPEITPMNPSGYIYTIGSMTLSGIRHQPELLVSWYIASNYNFNNIKFKNNLWWHLSGAALTIWLTRNWSAEQIISKAVEIRNRQTTTTVQQLQ